MKNQVVQEITVEQLEQLIKDLDYETEMGFETVNKNNKDIFIHCTVRYVPLHECKNDALRFEYERKTRIEIPYEIIEKIIVEKYYDGLWHEATIHCKNNMKYKLLI